MFAMMHLLVRSYGPPPGQALPANGGREHRPKQMVRAAVDLPVEGRDTLESMNAAPGGMTIGELAGRAGVTAKTVRYYEQIGLLPPPARTRSGYRRYGEDELHRLQFIAKAKHLGLSLEEIRGVLAVSATGSDPCPHVVGLVDRHLDDIDRSLARLSKFREQLAKLRAEVQRATRGHVCGIVEHASIEWVPLVIDRPLTRRLERRL